MMELPQTAAPKHLCKAKGYIALKAREQADKLWKSGTLEYAVSPAMMSIDEAQASVDCVKLRKKKTLLAKMPSLAAIGSRKSSSMPPITKSSA